MIQVKKKNDCTHVLTEGMNIFVGECVEGYPTEGGTVEGKKEGFVAVVGKGVGFAVGKRVGLPWFVVGNNVGIRVDIVGDIVGLALFVIVD